MRHLLIFIVALLDHWATLATGGLIMGGVWLYKDVLGYEYSVKINGILAFVFFLAAAFLAWREQFIRAGESLRPVQIGDAIASFDTELRVWRNRVNNGSVIFFERRFYAFKNRLRAFGRANLSIPQNERLLHMSTTELCRVMAVGSARQTGTRKPRITQEDCSQMIEGLIENLYEVGRSIRD